MIAAAAGLVLLAAAVASDFDYRSFWDRNDMLTSLVSGMLVVVVTVAVINEIVERRDRQRWTLLAQSVLFALTQSARATWTTMVELLHLGEVHSGSVQPLLNAAEVARDSTRVSAATRELLADPDRRAELQEVCIALSEHATGVIAQWAGIMVGARPYAQVINRHVELAGHLEWVSSILVQGSPPEEQSLRQRMLVRSSVVAERADEFSNDDWLHDQIVAIVMLATELDYRSRELALRLVPMSWWAERTSDLVGDVNSTRKPTDTRSGMGADAPASDATPPIGTQ